eukprot:SAG11_NODE_5160_length_1643_cov_5.228627_2_plen_126_part_00
MPEARKIMYGWLDATISRRASVDRPSSGFLDGLITAAAVKLRAELDGVVHKGIATLPVPFDLVEALLAQVLHTALDALDPGDVFKVVSRPSTAPRCATRRRISVTASTLHASTRADGRSARGERE